jgi:hypothetical protein
MMTPGDYMTEQLERLIRRVQSEPENSGNLQHARQEFEPQLEEYIRRVVADCPR